MSSMVEFAIIMSIYEGSQEIDLNICHRYEKSEINKLQGPMGLSNFASYKALGHATLALTRSQSCKKVMRGQVIQADLVI